MKILPKLIRDKHIKELYHLDGYQTNSVLQGLEGMNITLAQVKRWKSWPPGIYVDTGIKLGPFEFIDEDWFEKVGRFN